MEVSTRLSKGHQTGHETREPGQGGDRTEGTRPYVFGDPVSELELNADSPPLSVEFDDGVDETSNEDVAETLGETTDGVPCLMTVNVPEMKIRVQHLDRDDAYIELRMLEHRPLGTISVMIQHFAKLFTAQSYRYSEFSAPTDKD